MRVSRTLVVASLIAVLAFGLAATNASALPPLMQNDYGLQYAGKSVCIECHGGTYDASAHGGFASFTLQPDASATGMWPAGRIGAGLSVNANTVLMTLGANSAGAREYVQWTPSQAFNSPNGPYMLFEGMSWDPADPAQWVMPAEGISTVSYNRCNRCHQMGAQIDGTTPVFGHGSSTATFTAWARFPSAARDSTTTWSTGASIQCEVCHGTGLEAASQVGGVAHWNSGVKVVGGWSVTPTLGKVSSTNILDSSICGQCHGTYKTTAEGGTNTNNGRPLGYTADIGLTSFIKPYGFDAVPSESAFESNPSAYHFYPNGENRNLRHSYYSEWTLSGHSLRAALATSAPGVSEFQKSYTGHYSPTGRQDTCNKCHTGEGYMKRKGATVLGDFTPTATNEGFYGQECAICHEPHNIDEGGELTLRDPDTAGQGSCAGLLRSNTNICQDCHNWQAEVLNQPVVPSTSSRAVSHPQREVVWGKGMFDIPNADEFMPGAQCNECHMPATYAETGSSVATPRYSDQSVKRYSHRMFIMEPGDAANWGLGPSGDSCSQCHVSTSQDDLQARIDEWQSEAAALYTDAGSAYTAAASRPEATQPAGVELRGRANVNMVFYTADSSGGVHNPPYEQAGLMKAAFLANAVGGHIDTAELLYPMQVAQGAPAGVTANIDFGDDSDAVGANVALDRWNGSSWIQDALTTADVNGNVAYIVAPASTMQYRLRWERSSNPITDKTSASFTIQVIVPSSQVTVAVSPSTIAYGKSFTLSGGVLPSDPGQVVKIQVRKGSNGTWGFLSGGQMTLTQFSTFSKSVKPSGKASWYYKVKYYGNATTPGSTSAVVKVVVN